MMCLILFVIKLEKPFLMGPWPLTPILSQCPNLVQLSDTKWERISQNEFGNVLAIEAQIFR
jgi:hypothetical protein